MGVVNTITLKSVLNFRRVDQGCTDAPKAGSVKTSIRKSVGALSKGSPAIDQRGPVISSIRDSKGMETDMVGITITTTTMFPPAYASTTTSAESASSASTATTSTSPPGGCGGNSHGSGENHPKYELWDEWGEGGKLAPPSNLKLENKSQSKNQKNSQNYKNPKKTKNQKTQKNHKTQNSKKTIKNKIKKS